MSDIVYRDDDSDYYFARIEFYKELDKLKDHLVTTLSDVEKSLIQDLFRRVQESSDDAEDVVVKRDFDAWWKEFNQKGEEIHQKAVWNKKLEMLDYVGTAWWTDSVGSVRLSEGIRVHFTGRSNEDPIKLRRVVEDFWEKRVDRTYYITKSPNGASSGFILMRTRDGTKLYIGTFSDTEEAYKANPELWVQIDCGLELLLNHKEKRRLRRFLTWCSGRPFRFTVP